MKRRVVSIVFLCLMSIYVVPVFSMHICLGQENHHHGNCEGNMDKGGGKENKAGLPYQLDKGEHLHCFELQKENSPTIQPKFDVPLRQLALIAEVLHFKPDSRDTAATGEYYPPPNKALYASPYCIRPPPLKSKG